MPTDNYTGKQAYHGAVAARYDEDRIGEPLWAVEQEYVRQWTATVPAGALVLDVPVGTGRFLPLYAAGGLRVHGIDVSADMIAEARRRHGKSAGRCELAIGDAEHLSLPAQSVDRVVCWRLAHLLPAPVLGRVLAELRRVSRGEILLQVLSLPPVARPRPVRLRALLRPLARLLCFRRGAQPWTHITNFEHTEASLAALFAVAGLAVAATDNLGMHTGRPVVVYHLQGP